MSDMKLSEAIRLGSMLKPQLRARSFDGVATCAAAAACDAIGRLERWKDVWPIVKERWPIIETTAMCPVLVLGGNIETSVETGIIYLNDAEGWTREQIADWVQTIEDAQATRIECADQPALEPAFALPSAAQKNTHD